MTQMDEPLPPPQPFPATVGIALPVQIGVRTPTGRNSARYRGKGQLLVGTGVARLSGKVGYGRPGLWALLATFVSAVAANVVALRTTGVTFWPGLIFWIIVFDLIFRKRIDVSILLGGTAVYIPKKRVACVQVEDGKWVALRASPENTGLLLDHLRALFGERLTLQEKWGHSFGG